MSKELRNLRLWGNLRQPRRDSSEKLAQLSPRQDIDPWLCLTQPVCKCAACGSRSSSGSIVLCRGVITLIPYWATIFDRVSQLGRGLLWVLLVFWFVVVFFGFVFFFLNQHYID